ncbi:hypothetical protein QOT17_009950 [Balamuthia mandrillaris]
MAVFTHRFKLKPPWAFLQCQPDRGEEPWVKEDLHYYAFHHNPRYLLIHPLHLLSLLHSIYSCTLPTTLLGTIWSPWTGAPSTSSSQLGQFLAKCPGSWYQWQSLLFDFAPPAAATRARVGNDAGAASGPAATRNLPAAPWPAHFRDDEEKASTEEDSPFVLAVLAAYAICSLSRLITSKIIPSLAGSSKWATIFQPSKSTIATTADLCLRISSTRPNSRLAKSQLEVCSTSRIISSTCCKTRNSCLFLSFLMAHGLPGRIGPGSPQCSQGKFHSPLCRALALSPCRETEKLIEARSLPRSLYYTQ